MLNASKFSGVKIISLKKWEDQRGWLSELWRTDEIAAEEVPLMTYVSLTKPGICRGPHEHVHQTDLFGFVGPSTFELNIWDNRAGSPTFDQHETFTGGADEPFIAIIPPGVVHGYKNVGGIDGMVVNCANKLYKGPGKTEEVDEIRHEADPNSKFKIL